MIKTIKKIFSGEKGSEEMKKKEETQAELAVDSELAAQLEQAQESLASQAADMQALTEMVEELSAKFEQAQAALAVSEQTKADLIVDAKTKQFEARKAVVEAAVGTGKADALMLATEQLDDAQFNAIVSAMAMSFDNESKSLMFKEVGVSASTDATEVQEESAEMKLLKAKHPKSN